MKIVLIGISSDIGLALAKNWLNHGHEIVGTYMTPSDGVKNLRKKGVHLVKCDMANDKSVSRAAGNIRKHIKRWDVLVLLPATQEPVGLFAELDMGEWTRSITVNFTSHYRMLHDLLPARRNRSGKESSVIFFAGGGTNNATLRYSAYTAAKIAQIKMCELLDAEIKDTKFVIIGPGWVKTKIHEATLKAGKRAGDNYRRTIDKLQSGELTPMENIVQCCEWIVDAPREVVGGRNFSVVSDAWGSQALSEELRRDGDLYKLRRFGNERKFNYK